MNEITCGGIACGGDGAIANEKNGEVGGLSATERYQVKKWEEKSKN
jgi:hypothetical protein